MPFPWAEFWYHTLNYFFRDLLLSWVALFLYAQRRRIRDRVKRYFPVVVVGTLYLADALFMVSYLELDPGFMTVLSVLAGLFNNIVLVLLAAMCYHHWPNRVMKGLYFLAYYVTCLLILGDGIYFWNTSMHVESVLFDNLNIYAAKGILSTTENWQLGLLAAVMLLFIPLFRVVHPPAPQTQPALVPFVRGAVRPGAQRLLCAAGRRDLSCGGQCERAGYRSGYGKKPEAHPGHGGLSHQCELLPQSFLQNRQGGP